VSTLFDLYEPLFQYVCMLNRFARAGGTDTIEFAVLRNVVVSLLDGIKADAKADPVLEMQAAKLEMPILFFVDSMIAESRLQCAGVWHKHRLAYDRDELAGDEKFFDMLDETLNDSSNEATERLVIFYVCLGIGFTGWYANQPEYLRGKMQAIAKRISVSPDADRAARICPEAYEHLDRRNLIEPPGVKLGAILLAILGLSALVMAINFYLFRLGSISFINSLNEILRHDLMG
jgi:type VI secretion system protein ImpK